MSCERLDTAVSGDTDDVRLLVLTGGMPNDALAAALGAPGAVLSARVWAEGADPGSAESLALTVHDAARRIVALNLGGASGWLSSATAGDYLVDMKVNGVTYPSGGPIALLVRA